jgi:hypothetical protein
LLSETDSPEGTEGMLEANVAGLVGPITLLAAAALNLLLLRAAGGRISLALRGPLAVTTLVAARPDGESNVIAFPLRRPLADRAYALTPARVRRAA